MTLRHAFASAPLQVLVVDDSALVRQLMLGSLEQAGMKVQCAADPVIALERLRTWSPDVIVLDLEMPRMDGLTFLRVLSRSHDIPVVICSGVAGERSIVAMRALEEGAVDVVARPRIGLQQYFRDSHLLLADAIVAAAQARRKRRARVRVRVEPAQPRPQRAALLPQLIALGASTGGPEALHEIVAALPPDAPPVVVVQHMPEGFTTAFAKWLDGRSAVRVKEASDGERMRHGTVLVAPGGRHVVVQRDREGYFAKVHDGPLVARHRPSVDVMFDSVARAAGRHAVGVLLTGMGEDGRDGMLALAAAGAQTIAQDEATCVVFGMPKAAITAGAARAVLPLNEIARALVGPSG